MFKNSIFSILNNFLQLVISLSTAYYISRSLGVAGKGKLYLFTQIHVFLQLLLSFGIGQSILFNLKNSLITKPRLRSFSLFFLIIIASILVLFFWERDFLFTQLFGTIINSQEAILIFTITFLGVVNLLFGYELMSNSNRIKWNLVISILSNIFYFISILIIYNFFELTVYSVLFALFISYLVKAVITILLVWDIKDGFVLFSILDFKRLFSYGFQFLLNSFFLSTVYRIDTFFLSHYDLKNELGIYSVAVNISELILLVPNAIGVILFPYLAGLNEFDSDKMAKISCRINLYLGILGGLVSLLFGVIFIKFVFGEQFLPAYSILLILLPGIISMVLNITLSNYISSKGKPLIGTFFYFIATVLNLLLNYFTIEEYGLNAIATNATITYIVTSILFIRYVVKNSTINVFEIFIPSKSDFFLIFNYFRKIIFK